MELILKSDNKSKIAQILALANKLGVSVEQKGKEIDRAKPVLPPGKPVSVDVLLADFGKNPDFSTTEEVRSTAWPASW